MKGTIVLIEDDQAVNEAITMILQRSSFNVISFLVLESFDHLIAELPSLYLIDRQLTGVDGLELCKQLKNGKNTSHIPVVIMSASPNARKLALHAGADAFLEKPIPRQQLLTLLDSLI